MSTCMRCDREHPPESVHAIEYICECGLSFYRMHHYSYPWKWRLHIGKYVAHYPAPDYNRTMLITAHGSEWVAYVPLDWKITEDKIDKIRLLQ